MVLLDEKQMNDKCKKCGNHTMCTFRESNKTEKEIITRCANYNGWMGTEKYRKIIYEIDKGQSNGRQPNFKIKHSTQRGAVCSMGYIPPLTARKNKEIL